MGKLLNVRKGNEIFLNLRESKPYTHNIKLPAKKLDVA